MVYLLFGSIFLAYIIISLSVTRYNETYYIRGLLVDEVEWARHLDDGVGVFNWPVSM